MHKIAYLEGYMAKKAWTLPDVQESFNKMTINPAIRTALMAGAGYYGGKYLFRGVSDFANRRTINRMYTDPRQRAMAWQQYLKRRGKAENVVGALGAVTMGAVPAIDLFKAYKPAIKKFKADGAMKDLTAPLFNNVLPSSFDKYR